MHGHNHNVSSNGNRKRRKLPVPLIVFLLCLVLVVTRMSLELETVHSNSYSAVDPSNEVPIAWEGVVHNVTTTSRVAEKMQESGTRTGQVTTISTRVVETTKKPVARGETSVAIAKQKGGAVEASHRFQDFGSVIATDVADDMNRKFMNFDFMLDQMNEPAGSCQRQCPNGRRNHITYVSGPECGLIDRLFVLEKLINMAGYLCANLHVPIPYYLLADQHNNNQTGAPKITLSSSWDDYRIFEWASPTKNGTSSGEPAFFEMENPWKYPRYGMDKKLFDVGKKVRKGSRVPRPDVFLKTLSKEDSIPHFHQLESFVENQQHTRNNLNATNFFVWHMDFFWWRLDLFNQPANETQTALSTRPYSYPDMIPFWRKGCRYYSSKIPPHVQAVVDRLWERVQDLTMTRTTMNTTVGVLHIRRGDAKELCDTKLDKMKKYIPCSLKGTERFGNITILLQTDETDAAYLSSLTNLILNGRPHIHVVRLEELVLEVTTSYIEDNGLDTVRWGSNFFIFTVLSVFRHQRADFIMQQRREFHCPDCDSLVDRTDIRWGRTHKTNLDSSGANPMAITTEKEEDDIFRDFGSIYTTDIMGDLHRRFVNYNHMLDQMKEPAGACQRRCPNGRKNHITYASGPECGLIDRLFVLERLSNMAGYLCANLHVPKPHHLLSSERHNNNVSLSFLSSWNDYRIFEWASPLKNGTSNGEAILNEMENPWKYRQYGFKQGIFDARKKFDPNSQIPRPDLHMWTMNAHDSVPHFYQAEKYVNQQQSSGRSQNDTGFFVWHINYFFWTLDMYNQPANTTAKVLAKRPYSFPDGLPLWRKGCRYFSSRIPQHVQGVVDRLWERIQSVAHRASTVGVLHIRRGDGQYQCDTGLPKMQKYIACSLKDTEQLGKITILIQTDETDGSYLNNITRMLSEEGPHIQVANLEEIVLETTTSYIKDHELDEGRWKNNFFIFNVLSVFRYQHAAFTMEQRRDFQCPSCDPLLKKQNVQWTGRQTMR